MQKLIGDFKASQTTAEAEYKKQRTAYNKITQEKVAAVAEKEAKEAAAKQANMFKDTERTVKRIDTKTATLNKQL